MLRTISPQSEPVEDVVEMIMSERRGNPDRPWLMLNFVTSIDGATAVGGRSTALNDDDDKALFGALRAVPDVILVGASTVIAEDYGPVTLDEDRRRRRLAAGLGAAPILAIVSGSLSIDPGARVFSDPDHKPMIITGADANPAKVALLGDSADLVFLEDLTADAIMRRLGASGIVLCEGGPTLAGEFVAAGLVDELNVTRAPFLVGGTSKPLLGGIEVPSPVSMTLDRALLGEHSLFLRYLRA